MTFGLASYFDKINVSEAIGHEFARAAVSSLAFGEGVSSNPVAWKDLPLRRLADLFSLSSRYVIPAITTLTLSQNRFTGEVTFLLHWRDPACVATASGMYDVIPAGEFQPSSISPASQSADFDLWRNIVREFSEELCGMPEHDGSSGTFLDYELWPFFRTITEARSQGRVKAYCLGVGLDALTLACTIPTVVVIDQDAFEEIFGEIVAVNAERTIVKSLDGSPPGIPFTAEIVDRLLRSESMAPPGAACLYLAWKHRERLLLGGH